MGTIGTKGNSFTRGLRWSYGSAIVGSLVWIALFFVLSPTAGTIVAIEALALFGVLVVVPLTLPFVLTGHSNENAHRLHAVVVRMQPIAAIIAAGAFLLSPGLSSALCILPWLGFAGLAALVGVTRFLNRRTFEPAALCIDAGLVYIPIGAGWLLLSRMRAHPMGFSDLVVILTAVHFHYAGFVAPIIAGLTGNRLRTTPLFASIAAGVIAGPPLIAIGITVSPLIEIIAVAVFAGSLIGLALIMLVRLIPALESRGAQALAGISAVSLLVTMLAAGAYGVSTFTGWFTVTIPRMVQVHGMLNAFGFALCGILSWHMISDSEVEPTII